MTDDLAHLQTALADRYTIERELGAGGMATVFLARDRKHDRLVAIKLMRKELASAIGSDRFLLEVRVAAQFSHPNILGLIDSGTLELGTGAPVPYYIMPFADGESLRERLEREGALPTATALRIAAEVADGLSYAHARGVIHRDIKPENILLVGGHALLADFGIAKALESAGERALTGTGLAIGTPVYMSPEQATGEPVDARSDVYSLAVTLFEMLAGEPPISGATPQSILARRLHEPPPRVRTLRETVTPGVDALVARAMALAPADRHSSAAELRDEILAALEGGSDTGFRRNRRLAFAASGIALLALAGVVFRLGSGHRAADAAPRSLAVLPFVNTSGSPEDEYLSDGVADELANSLGKTPGLRLAARSSTMRFKGANADIHEIGRQLGVAGVVEGTVRRAGERIRVSAELVNVADGLTLWSETYERSASEALGVHDEMAAAIRAALGISAPARARGIGTTSPQAYELFLKGRYLWSHRDREAFRRAIEYFEQAIRADSTFARAWAGIGDSYSLLGAFGHLPPTEAFSKGRAAASRALALDSTLADAYTALGFINLFYDWDWDQARQRFDAALALDPRYGEARLFRAWYLVAVNRLDAAVETLREAVADEPVSLILNARLGTMLMLAGQPTRAIAQHRKTLELDSSYAISHLDLARLLAEQGDFAGASRELAFTSDTVGTLGAGVRGYIYAKARRRDDALREIERLRSDRERSFVVAAPIAAIYGALGDMDRAFEWLDRAYADRNWTLLIMRTDPMLTALRGDPRWDPAVARMAFPR
jgi:serine/threonine-protein kinase